MTLLAVPPVACDLRPLATSCNNVGIDQALRNPPLTWGSTVCGIRDDHTGYCWCRNSKGQAGTGDDIEYTVPQPIASSDLWVDIEVGTSASCGITTTGFYKCWGGIGDVMALPLPDSGDGTWNLAYITPHTMDDPGPWDVFSSGYRSVCGIKMDQSLWCWGANFLGEIGNGQPAGGDYNTPQQVNAAEWIDVTVNDAVTCGIQTDGTGWCWGSNWSGQTGHGDYNDTLVPTAVTATGYWNEIWPGYAHTCGVKTDNTGWCWGEGWGGQLGNGAQPADSTTPVQVIGKWRNISPFSYSTTYAVSPYNVGSFGGELDYYSISMYRYTPQDSICGTPAAEPGSLYFNNTLKVMQYCDGAGWATIGK